MAPAEKARSRSKGFQVTEGVKKTQDICFQVLKEAGHPLAADELVKRVNALGSPISKGSTLTIYLRFDERKRFVRTEPGVWTLAA